MRQVVFPMPGIPTIIRCGLLRMEVVHDTSSPLLLSPIRIAVVVDGVTGDDGKFVEEGCGFDSDADDDGTGGDDAASTTGIGTSIGIPCCSLATPASIESGPNSQRVHWP